VGELGSIIFLALFVIGVASIVVWAVRRPQQVPAAPDLRRADDAEATMPDAATITEQVSGTVTQTWPVK